MVSDYTSFAKSVGNAYKSKLCSLYEVLRYDGRLRFQVVELNVDLLAVVADVLTNRQKSYRRSLV